MLKNCLGEAMNEKFDLQEYLTKGVERIVGEAVRATLKNPRESAFMLKFAAESRIASQASAIFIVQAVIHGAIMPLLIPSL